MSVLALPELDLNHEQQNLVESLERTLQPDQALWLGGYFTALGRSGGRTADARPDSAQPQAASRPTAAPRPLTILFGSETGNCASLARLAGAAARDAGLQPSVIDMAEYKLRALKDEQDLLIITATHGEGDPPQSAKPFFEFLESRKAPKLAGKRFVVVALGDSTYEHYCAAGRHLDRRLEALGATRLAPCTDCDVDYEDVAADAIKAALAALKPRQMAGADAPLRSGAPSAFLATPHYDKRHPFIASVLDNFVLTGRGSSKETRHIELSLEGSGLAFDPGDALGVLPRNDPQLVDAILERTALFADTSVAIKDRTMTLGEALTSFFEIAQATPRLIDHWAELSDAGELRALRGEDRAEARALFLRDHHVIDIVQRFPVRGIDAQTFIAGLRPLQPRLYSIASSQAMAPDEVHLTISTLRYDLRGERRTGVTSGFFAERVEPGTGVPVHIQSNPHFRLPNDDVAILMIGAGTGVAPYRAFLQEREARDASGKSWLVFGERNFRTDFLYQTEWQDHLKSGVLSRMNVAFSRDRLPKTYVQHRLLEHSRDVYAWLEEGAHLYVCGDANNLAPDVHAALRAIIEREGGRGGLATQDYLDALQRDRRYHIDVY